MIKSPSHGKKTRRAPFIRIEAKLSAVIKLEKPGLYFVHCPELDVASQGKTVAEARKNIAEAVQLFLEGCWEMGTLQQVLLDCGFSLKEPAKARAKRPQAKDAAPSGKESRSFFLPPVSIPVFAPAGLR